MNRLIYQHASKRAALRAALLLGMLGCAASAQAIDVYFTGKLVAPPPCVINGNTDIDVDFGDNLIIGRIDGTEYSKPINYGLDCSIGAAISTSLKMQLQGSPAGFGTGLLGTNKGELGIELRNGGDKLPINTWLNFTDPARPVLSAVPVKSAVGTLSGGTFTAAATLLVEFQ